MVTGVTRATEQIKLPFTVTRVDTTQMPVSGSNPLTQLQGKIPGALIVNASGRPGAAPSIVLRGPVSLNATGRTQQPLYLLDGVPLSGGLPDINPSDIENVEVVKGAAAASLYGARAGAGVINITTKSGKNAPEGVRFGVRTEAGTSDIERAFPLATRRALATDPTGQLFCTTEVVGGSPCGRYIDWDQEVQRINNSGEDFSLPPQKFLRDFGIGVAPNYAALTGLYLVTPWQHLRDPVGQVVSPSKYANTNLDMRGKVGNTGVYASLSNFVQEGAIKFLPGFTRNSARVNVDQRFGDRISANVNSYYGQTIDHGANFDETSGTAGTWFNLTRAPWMSDMLATDNLGRVVVRQNPLDQGTQNFNPLYSTQYNKRTDRGTRFVGGTSLRYTPLDWLSLEANAGYDRSTAYTLQMRDKGWRVTAAAPSTSAGFIQNGGLDNETFTTSLSGSATRTFFNDLNATFSTSSTCIRSDAFSTRTRRAVLASSYRRARIGRCGDEEFLDLLRHPGHSRHGLLHRRGFRLQGSLHPRRPHPPRRQLAVRSRKPLADLRSRIGRVDRVARAVVARWPMLSACSSCARQSARLVSVPASTHSTALTPWEPAERSTPPTSETRT